MFVILGATHTFSFVLGVHPALKHLAHVSFCLRYLYVSLWPYKCPIIAAACLDLWFVEMHQYYCLK